MLIQLIPICHSVLFGILTGVCSQICITTHPDTVLPIRVECKNVATVNIPPKMAATSVFLLKCVDGRSVVESK